MGHVPTPREPEPPKRKPSTAYTPKPGFDWNPLRAFRNVACPCGSKRKAKKCHGRLDLLPDAQVAEVKQYLQRLSAAGIIEVRMGDVA